MPADHPGMEVTELWRWPVTGVGGERVPSLRVHAGGVAGDGAHAVVDGGAALEAWQAAYPFAVGAVVDPAAPPYPVLTSPRGRRFAWNDPRLRFALQDALGHPVQLRRDPAAAGAVLVATDGSRAHVHLQGSLALAPGAKLRFSGGVRLRLLEGGGPAARPARVLTAGRLAQGEDAEIVAG